MLRVLSAALLAACDRDPADPRSTDRIAECAGVLGELHSGVVGTETWRNSRPHVIRDSLVVQGTLVIEPGVKVCGDSAAKILIATNGRLVALGSANAPIIFTAIDRTKPWSGIDVQYECLDWPCIVPALRGQIRHALFEYAQNAVIGVQVDSSHFRQIRCTAVRTRHLTNSVVDTAGIDGCPAVVMGSGWGGTDTFIGNIIRGSGGVGLNFVTQSLNTSGRARDSLVLRDSRIENSAGVGLRFDSKYSGAHISDGNSIRIVGSGSHAVEAPLATVLQLWPTRAAQDSLLGNGNDTLVVWGNASTGEIVARENLHWRFKSDFLIPWYVLSAVNIRIEPGGTLVSATELRLQGSLLVQGTAARRANLVGGIIRQCFEAGPCLTQHLSYASLTNVYLSTGPHATLDHLEVTGGSIALGTSSVLTNSILIAPGFVSYALILLNNTRVENVIIRASTVNAIDIFGADVVLANCEISASRSNGINVLNPPVMPTANIQVRNCIFENNARAGINNVGTQPSVVDASFNWWGDAGGPFGPTGDSVSANVDYSPHLTTRPVITID